MATIMLPAEMTSNIKFSAAFAIWPNAGIPGLLRKLTLSGFVLLSALSQTGCGPSPLEAEGLTPSSSFVYSAHLIGTILRASSPSDVGEKITFTDLDTFNPKVAYSGTGSTSAMKILGEAPKVITLQLFTGHSIDTFIIDKNTGMFSRTSAGTSFGVYASAAIGRCE